MSIKIKAEGMEAVETKEPIGPKPQTPKIRLGKPNEPTGRSPRTTTMVFAVTFKKKAS